MLHPDKINIIMHDLRRRILRTDISASGVLSQKGEEKWEGYSIRNL